MVERDEEAPQCGPFTVFDRTFSYQRFSHIAMELCYFASFDAMLEIIMAVFC